MEIKSEPHRTSSRLYSLINISNFDVSIQSFHSKLHTQVTLVDSITIPSRKSKRYVQQLRSMWSLQPTYYNLTATTLTSLQGRCRNRTSRHLRYDDTLESSNRSSPEHHWSTLYDRQSTATKHTKTFLNLNLIPKQPFNFKYYLGEKQQFMFRYYQDLKDAEEARWVKEKDLLACVGCYKLRHRTKFADNMREHAPGVSTTEDTVYRACLACAYDYRCGCKDFRRREVIKYNGSEFAVLVCRGCTHYCLGHKGGDYVEACFRC